LRLAGAFNVANALAAIAVGVTQRLPLERIAAGVEAVAGIPGRFESVEEGQPFTVVVDYAHKPDGLEQVLRTARDLTAGRVIVVFGCGGDRDRAKRPMMGQIAAQWADDVIVTSDNPRTEDPARIIEEIRPGVEAGQAEARAAGRQVRARYEPARRDAIAAAIAAAGPGDVVLIAGKGHETYQEIAGVKHPFDDRQVVRECLRTWHRHRTAAGSGRPRTPTP
jgi:UDP-N-acetylmuramoyl-L-alanyl-D-glutamate--2,6-diaminopimelate ligase